MLARRDRVFVDTNVLVYGQDASQPEKRELARSWLLYLWRERTGRLSIQVLHEYYVTVTRKLKPGMRPARARADIRDLTLWHPVSLDDKSLEAGWAIEDQYALSLWDALIVAAAQVSGCRYLLTEDLQAGQVLGGIEVIDPFRSSPEELFET